MKLKNLSIGNQLRLSLGIIVALVFVLGTVAWFQASSLWEQTEGLYSHPLTVRRALGELNADLLIMQRNSRDQILTDNDPERLAIQQSIDVAEANAQKQFDILYDSYLGPRKDVDDAHTTFVEWKTIRDETLRVLRLGKTAEAIGRTKDKGVSAVHVEKLMGEIQDISDFAKSRGDKFYADAQNLRSTLKIQLGIVLMAILLLSGIVIYVLQRMIREPLDELIQVTDQYRQGQLDARSRYAAKNEFGSLVKSFNNMAETMQLEMQCRENIARVAEVMLNEDELGAFCRELLKVLLQHTGSQVGAIYVLNEAKTDFEHFESIGLAAVNRTAFSVSAREGEFGTALATRRIQRLTEIPADSRFTLATMAGDFMPRDIITIPILSGSEVVAMVSLASIRSYPAPALRLVNDIWQVLTARMNGVLALRQIRSFSARLEQQNRELEAQKRELAAQTDELSEQNLELEMQKKQLDEASRLKSTFLSNMSHELRTPLNSVIGLSGILRRRLRTTIPAEESGYLEVIERNGKHLLDLINDVLDLARIESGRDEISLSQFSVRDLAGEVVAMLEPQVREKGIVLRNQVAADLPPLCSDAGKFRHILQNLVGNAVKFTGQGSVEISARVADGDMLVAVTDTGIGIAADKLEAIFEEFRQADESMTKLYGGTGLGLAIARKYAILLHGAVTVESALGKGSTFTIRLPLATSEADVAGNAEKAPEKYEPVRPVSLAEIPKGNGKCILVVEDSEPAAIQMTDILKEQGYRVLMAHNGREALEQVGRILPDAMILDLMMPEVDGFQVLQTIRAEPRTVPLPVLILTARHVSREELSFLKGNHIHQLIQKGNINRAALLAEVGRMVAPPAAPPIPAQMVPKPVSAVRPRPDGKPLVLVVEDNPDNRLTIQALIEDVCTVITAADGQEGVEQAKAHRPDLILMDIAMPVMDGILALAALRKEEGLRQIPVVALTASAMKGSREEILAYGFDAYISKPIDTKLLLKTIGEMLGEEGTRR
jgi:signal transduction histidine kinase/DNA-binding response OmpR family regulator/CHASE3 domain sensor protein